MDDKIYVAVISAIFGFSLPYLAGVWDRATRARRIVSALNRELSEATAEIERKLAWVGRDVSTHLSEVDRERVIEARGIHLYLGERETFEVPRLYWKAKYTEIAEAINDKDYSFFYKMYRLIDRFEQKFHEMKVTFESPLGKKESMALACWGDLNDIGKELQSGLISRSSGHR
jgi:hypothetical protein